MIWQNPLPQGNPLYDIAYITNDSLLAVGERGVLAISTDGGTSWGETRYISTYNLRSICFTNKDTGFVVGEVGNAGIIMKTTDRGATWTEIISGTTPGPIYSVFFLNDTLGYTAGSFGRIYKTVNGGVTWSLQSSGSSLGLQDLYFTSVDTGYVVGGDNKVRRTFNGGTTWTAFTTSTTSFFNSVWFTDSNTGWAAGNSQVLFKSTDAGITWTQQTPTYYSLASTIIYPSNVIRDVYFTSVDTGYICGDNLSLYRTTDGGVTFRQLTASPYYLRKCKMNNDQKGVCIGLYNSTISSSDNGDSWNPSGSGSTSYFYGGYFVNKNYGYAAGGGGTILHTEDAGQNWSTQNSGITDQLSSVHFPSLDTGYVVGNNGKCRRTFDGGNTWTNSTTGITGYLTEVYFPSNNVGYLCAQTGAIRKTVNAGQTWTFSPNPSGFALYDIYFLNLDTGFVVGNNGTIMKTVDGGVNWVVKTSNTVNYLQTIFFTDDMHGFAAGENGRICKTTDGGETWTATSAGYGDHIQSLHFYDQMNGYFVTGQFNGSIYRTVNGGISWSFFGIPTNTYLWTVQAVERDTIEVFGASGLIMRVNVAVPSIPSDSLFICEGVPAQLSAPASEVYNWYSSDGVFLGSGNTFLTDTLYNDTLFYMSKTTSGCITGTSPYHVFIAPPDLPILNSGDTTICEGDTLSLSTTNTFQNYTWSDSSNANSLSVFSEGDYSVEVTSMNGCLSWSDTIHVSIDSIPEVNAGTDQTVCLNTTVTLTATGTGISYGWNNNIQNTIPFSAEIPGDYIVTAISSWGCINSDTVQITLLPLPTISFSAFPDSVCNTSTPVFLDATPTGGTFSGNGVTGNDFDPSITGTGIQEIFYSLTDINGCSNTDTMRIFVENCLGLYENEKIHLMIYPNPASDFLYLEIESGFVNSEIYLEISDIRGRIISSDHFEGNQYRMDISEFSPGIYFVNCSAGNDSVMVKIILEK